MKIRISYLPEEGAVAKGLASIIRSFFNSCKLKQKDKQAGTDEQYCHIYMETKNKK